MILGFYIDRIWTTMRNNDAYKVLKKGSTVVIEYMLANGKIRVKRVVTIKDSDDKYVYIDTGVLRNTPIHKTDILSVDHNIYPYQV